MAHSGADLMLRHVRSWRKEPSQRRRQGQLLMWLFDRLVGSSEERFRHLDAQRLGGFQVDYKGELGGPLDGEIARLLAF
jgi:hypothetical protein